MRTWNVELRTFAIEDILLGSILPIDAVELKAKVLALVLRVGDAHDGWWSGRLTVGADGGNDGVLVHFGLEERPYACDYTDRHFIYRKECGTQVKCLSSGSISGSLVFKVESLQCKLLPGATISRNPSSNPRQIIPPHCTQLPDHLKLHSYH